MNANMYPERVNSDRPLPWYGRLFDGSAIRWLFASPFFVSVTVNKLVEFIWGANAWQFQRACPTPKNKIAGKLHDLEDSSALSVQALKEMLSRKRHNDLVREREFSMLRKLKARVTTVDSYGGQYSTFSDISIKRNVQVNPEDLVGTLKKIDDIEAQMRMQWRNPYHPTPSIEVMPTDATASILALPDSDNLTPPTSSLPSVSFDSDTMHNPELEDASILFASGDDAGAEAGLLVALGPQAKRSSRLEDWFVLFDFYRATSQFSKFEKLSVEFVGQFGRSAPLWIFISASEEPTSRLLSGGNRTFLWSSPTQLNAYALSELMDALNVAPMPWLLDWRNLRTIGEDVAEPLHALFTNWTEQAIHLHFSGAKQLTLTLHNAITSCVSEEASEVWRKLHMQVLRVLNQPDEFELAASSLHIICKAPIQEWTVARCTYYAIDSSNTPLTEKSNTIQSLAYIKNSKPDTANSNGNTSEMSQQCAHELGSLIGEDAHFILSGLELKSMQSKSIVISCAKLMRVDFSTASALLKWVSDKKAEQCVVQFVDVNRLVSEFLRVVGIGQYAQVITRIE